MAYNIRQYRDSDAENWDDFVLNRSMNGTFLQTRKFIGYHPNGKFKDCSLCVFKGDELVAAILACEVMEEGKKTFFAHKGTTFGGVTITENIYSASVIDEIFAALVSYIRETGYEKIYLKMVPDVFQKQNTDLLDYFLYKMGFNCHNELNYYLNMEEYRENLTGPFSPVKRRHYRYSLKNKLDFRRLDSKEAIADYYEVLLRNLNKFGAKAVHSLEELYDLRFCRFEERIEFYGVYWEGKIVAGSMLFYFGNDIMHTQYLSSDERFLKLYPMDFLIVNLIQTALKRNIRVLTLGICTEDKGRYLNLGLSRFKEGFGAKFCINRSYEKIL